MTIQRRYDDGIHFRIQAAPLVVTNREPAQKRRCSSFGYPPCSAFLAGDHQGLLCASCLWRRAEAIVEKGRERV